MKSEREKNQQAMPLCAAFVAEMREHFPELTVTYASENGIEKGKRIEGEQIIPFARPKNAQVRQA